jgi:hypothetical protein
MKDFIEQLWYGTIAIIGFYYWCAWLIYMKTIAILVRYYRESRSSYSCSNVLVEVVEGSGGGLSDGVRGIANDDPVRLSAGEGGRCQSAAKRI